MSPERNGGPARIITRARLPFLGAFPVKNLPVLAVLAGLAAPAFADDWPQWLGPKRDGYWRETGIVDSFPKDGPPVLWRQPVGMGYAGPAVAGGKIFLPDRYLADGENNPANAFAKTAVKGKERVQCLDEKTGKPLWKFDYDSEYRISYAAGPRCTPTVDGDELYHLGAMGDFYCLKVSDGSVVWEKHFLKDYEATLPVWGFSSHPLVDGDQIICLVGGAGGKGVVSFDKKTGKEKWAALTINNDPGYSPPVIFEINGKRELIMWHTHAVVSLNPESGKKNWQYDWEIQSALTAPTPRLVNKTQLFFSSFYNGSLLLDVSSGSPKVIWKSKSKGGQAAVMPDNTVDLHSIMPTPVIAGDHIYGVCSYGELRCLELQTGKRVWMTHEPIAGKSVRWGNAFITPHEDRYFLFNEQGELLIAKFTPQGYTEVSRAKILEPTNKMALGRPVVWSHPAYANKTMYVRNDKELVAVSLKK